MLDEHSDQSDAPRARLLDQLAYLAAEADALQSVIGHVPDPVLDTHPVPGELSVKELYALLLRTDEMINRPFVDGLVDGADPQRREAEVNEILGDTAWNQMPIEHILARLAESRRNLVNFCTDAADDAWTNTGIGENGRTNLFSCLYDIVQHDVEVLRRLGERLHDARLSNRTRGIPQ